MTRLDRFLDLIAISESGCWVWTGAHRGAGRRYGCFWDGSRNVSAHRWSYEQWIGPIPAGMQIDHLCRNTHCVNPDHLEPVTNAENRRRANEAVTTCKLGHELKARPNGRRFCPTCNAETCRNARSLRRERGLPAGDPRHGTVNGYQNYGCRCPECSAAQRAANRRRAA